MKMSYGRVRATLRMSLAVVSIAIILLTGYLFGPWGSFAAFVLLAAWLYRGLGSTRY